MTISLPKIPRPQDVRLPARRRWADRIKLPDLSEGAEALDRISLPNLSGRIDLPNLSGRIDLPDVPDLTKLPERLPAPPERLRIGRREPPPATLSWPRRGLTAILLIVSAAAGAVAAFFLDPERGRGRRIQTANQLAGLGRRAGRRVGRWARYATSTVGAVGERIQYRTTDYRPANDATLAAKVESQLFRDPSIPKGRMNINVENGVVILRGTADSDGQIERIVAGTKAIPGVRAVRSLLRTPGEPAVDELGQPKAAGPSGLGEMAGPIGDASDEFAPSSPGL